MIINELELQKYSVEDFNGIMEIPLKIETNKPIDDRFIFNGKIIKLDLAGNYPNSPARIYFLTTENKEISLSIYNIKQIEK